MVKIIFYGGINEIGGNKILLEDEGTKIFLDFGMSFAQRKKYFLDPYLTPRNRQDLIELNLLPDMPELYESLNDNPFLDMDKVNMDDIGKLIELGIIQAEDAEGNIVGLSGDNKLVNGVLLSHAHEDHYKYVGFIDRANVYCNSQTANLILALKQCNRTNFENDIDNIRIVKKDNPFKIGNLLITPVQVNHSAYGSSAYIVNTSIGNIIYTGDFRLGELTSNFIKIAKESKPKIMICEGTNVGNKKKDCKNEEEVMKKMGRILKKSQGLIFIDFSLKNIERFNNVHKLAFEYGKKLAIPTKLFYILARILYGNVEDFSKEVIKNDKFRNLYVYYRKKEKYDKWEKNIIENDLLLGKQKLINASNLKEEELQKQFVVLFSFFDLKCLPDIKPKNAVFIKSSCEPFDEEMEIDEKIFDNWLDRYNIKRKNIHTSGHIRLEELKKIVKEIKPEFVIPVHTEKVSIFKKEMKKCGVKVIIPEIGKNCLENMNNK